METFIFVRFVEYIDEENVNRIQKEGHLYLSLNSYFLFTNFVSKYVLEI